MTSGNIDLGFDAAERRTFLLLVAGHLLFVVALFTAGPLIGENTLHVIAMLFGLPLAVLGRGDRRLARALVLIAGFGLVHYGAVFCATKSVHMPFTGEGFTDSPWVAGAIGGLVGAAGSFALCALAGLLRPGRRTLLAAAIAALTVIGAVGVYMLVNRVGAGGGRNGIASYLLIYTPWQLAFAWFLAKLLRS